MALSLSRRGDVEPFHAMDVLAEANRLKSLGHPVISMAVGQPSDPAPIRGSRGRCAGAAGRPHRLYRRAWASPPARGDRRALRTNTTASTSRPSGSRSRPARRRRSTSPSSQCSMSGDRVAMAAPGYPAYRNILAALGIEVVEIEIDRRRPSHRRTPRTPRMPKSR